MSEGEQPPQNKPPAPPDNAPPGVETIELIARQDPELARSIEALPPEHRGRMLMLIRQTSLEVRHSPRLPVIPASDIDAYNKARPDAGNRVFDATLDAILVVHEQKRAEIARSNRALDANIDAARQQQSHEHALAHRIERRRDLGLVLGFVFGLILLGACVTLALLGLDPFAIGSLAAIAIALITGTTIITALKRPESPPRQLPPPTEKAP